jgi:hypothetical protein
VNQKVLIIVLVALVVIFVITVGIGGCHASGNRRTDDESAVGALKGLQGNRFLEIGDKASASPPSCGSPGAQTLTVNGSCVITFEKRAFFRRSTRVVFRPNSRVSVIVVPRDGPRQDEQVNQGECFATAVNHSGGTLTLKPLVGTTATLFLQRRPCE